MNVTKRPRANDDLDHYAVYFARMVSAALAIRFLESAERTIARLVQFPGIGSPYPLANPLLQGLRHLPIDGFPNHFLFYLCPTADEIEIVRVMNAARNLTSLLEREA